MNAGARSVPRGSRLGDVAVTLSRHASIYALGSGIAICLALANAVVLAQFLSPGDFGRLGLLLLVASLLTILQNAPILSGSMRRAFGVMEDDDDDEGEDAGPEVRARDRRDSIGTGILSTALLGTAVCVAAAVLSPSIAIAIGLDAQDGRGIVALTAACGALTALWQVVVYLLRREGRPIAYVALSAVRSVLVIAISVAFVANGARVGGALAGVALGTALALLGALAVTRASWRLRLRRSELAAIVRISRSRVLILVSLWVIQHVDLFVIARYASADTLGHYRFAGRVAAVVGYASSAFFGAWAPLNRTSTLHAAYEQRAQAEVRAIVAMYVLFGVFGLSMAAIVLGDALVSVVPASYASAATLVPVLALTFLAHAVMRLAYRMSWFRGKRSLYIGLLVGAAVLFVPLCALFTARYGPAGAALTVSGTFLAIAVVIWWRGQAGVRPVPLAYGRVAAAASVAGGCYALSGAGGVTLPTVDVATDVVALLLYPAALLVLGIVPSEHRPALRRLRRAVLARGEDQEAVARWAGVDPDDRDAVRAALADGPTMAGDEVVRRASAVLRVVAATEDDDASDRLLPKRRRQANLDSREAVDLRLGRYLFATGPAFDRHALLLELVRGGVSASLVADLERARDLAAREIAAERRNAERKPSRAPLR